MNDRKIGYIVLALLALLCVAAIGYGVWERVLRIHTYLIEFPRIGNLKIDDPVLVQGVDLGRITATTPLVAKNFSVLVEIETRKPLAVHRNYRIATVDKGFMGDRIITMHCGDPSLERLGSDDTLRGVFYPGISEIIGQAPRLFDLIDFLNEKIDLLTVGADGRPSVQELFIQYHSQIDSASMLLAEYASLAQKYLPEYIRQINRTTKLLHETGQSASRAVPAAIAQSQKTLETVETLITMADTLSRRVQRVAEMTEQLEKEHGSSLAGQISSAVQSMESVLKLIHDESLRLKIRPSL